MPEQTVLVLAFESRAVWSRTKCVHCVVVYWSKHELLQACKDVSLPTFLVAQMKSPLMLLAVSGAVQTKYVYSLHFKSCPLSSYIEAREFQVIAWKTPKREPPLPHKLIYVALLNIPIDMMMKKQTACQ